MSSEDQQALRLRLVYFMRRLLLAPLILVLSSCSYGSFYEAEKACFNWIDKGPTYKYESTDPNGNLFVETGSLRRCVGQNRTNQLIGLKDNNKRNGAYYKLGTIPERKSKVVKRFKY